LAGPPAFPKAATTLAMLCFGLMFSLPFLVPFHQVPIASFQSEWLAMGLGLLGSLFLLTQKRGIGWQLPRLAIAPLALMLVVGMQLAAGMFAYAASAATIALYLVWTIVLALAGRTLAASVGAPRMAACLAWFLLAGGLVNAGFGLLQYLQLSQDFGALISAPMPVSLYGIYGNLAQQNHFADQMALAIACASYLRLTHRLMTPWYCAFCLVLVSAIFLSGSRSSFLYLAGIGAAAYLTLRSEAGTARRRPLFLVAAALAGMACALWLLMRAGAATAQLDRLFSMAGAFGPRMYLWAHALQMFWAHPVLGAGFDAFALRLVEQVANAPHAQLWGIDQYAHNLILQLMAVSGLCGLLAVTAPGAAFLLRLARTPNTPERFWAWSILGVLLIHSMFEQPLYYSYFLGPFALVAGMSDPAAWRIDIGRVGRTAAALLLAAALALLGKSASDYDELEGNFYSGRYTAADPVQQAARHSELVRALDAHSLFAPLAELVSPGDFVAAQAPVADKLRLNLKMMHYAPIAETEFRQAALLAENGQPTQAMQQFRQAAIAYPAEAGQYLERFDALAASEPARYAQVDGYAKALLKERDGARK
jgi:O-antigen ligase